MAESYKQVFVVCPFYKWSDDKRKITCEGITEDCSLTLNYKSKAAANHQLDSFCCDRYKKCGIYRLLMSDKYTE